MGHVFTNELRVAPEEHKVLLTEAPLNPKKNREKMAQIMFETFYVPGLYIAIQEVLTLYSSGKVTGIVLDSGDSVTHAVPIFEGYSLPNAVMRLDFGGRDLTHFMMKELFRELGPWGKITRQKGFFKSVKEKSCYVALDFEEELKLVEPYVYELPDFNPIIIKEPRIRCPEALFKPSLIGKEGNGIAQACYDSIQKCDIDLRRDFYSNIFLSGGTTLFEGFPERIEKEIGNLVPESMRMEIKVTARPDRKFAVWKGGSILSESAGTESMWITKEEYEEWDATIVHRKCF